jgi:Planctomycete cytochrome C
MFPKRSLFTLLIPWFALIGLALGASHVLGQEELSKKEKLLVKQLEDDIEKVESLLKRERFPQAQKAFEAALDRLQSIAKTPSSPLVAAVNDDLEKLNGFKAKLAEKKITVPEIPTISAPPAAGSISFKNAVAPILVGKCGNCHVRGTRGDFGMATFSALEKSGFVVPGDPVSSKLIQVIDNGEMPKGNLKVTEAELKTLRDWIKAGAVNDGKPDDPLGGAVAAPPSEDRAPDVALKKATGKETVSFSRDVAPILVGECKGCHVDSDRPRGNLNMNNFASILRGGDAGPMLVPGKSSESLLIKKLMGTGGGNRMPPQRDPLKENQIALIKKWIDEGATFDGNAPTTPTKVIAAVARAASLNHEALSADRLKLAEANWAKALTNVKALKLDRPEIRALGTVTDERLQELVNSAEDLIEKSKSNLNLEKGEPLVKGKLTAYFFEKRYDFNELSMMLEGHALPKDTRSTWKNDTVDVYIAMAVDPAVELNLLQPELCRVIGAAGVSAMSIDVPNWFADGMGYTIAERAFPKSDEVKAWRPAAIEAGRKVKRIEDLIDGKLSQQITGLAGFQLVNLLRQDGATFKRLIADLRAGKDFDGAFQKNYKSGANDWIKQLSSPGK